MEDFAMNTLLCSYLSAHAAEDTLFVLWGFSSEDAGLPRPSLDALLQQRLSRYLSSLLQQNPCVITAEEFALHADTLAQEFPHIILVQNTCYRTLLPVSVTLTPEMQSGLLSHFDPETPQDAPLPGIEPCLRVYSNLLHTEGRHRLLHSFGRSSASVPAGRARIVWCSTAYGSRNRRQQLCLCAYRGSRLFLSRAAAVPRQNALRFSRQLHRR